MGSKGDAKVKPWCPFCGMDVGRPTDGVQRKMREFPMGHCECGAVYVSDATGHNVGAAMVECLVTACGDHWDLAWELIPEDDYLTGRIEDYDEVTHRVVAKRNLDGRAVRGVLYFVRLHREMNELVQRLQRKQEQDDPGSLVGEVQAVSPLVEPKRDPKRQRKRADKRQVQQLAHSGDIDALVDLCLDDRRTLRFLQRLLYEPDTAARYRIAWILGEVCGRVATREPGPVADLLHRLFEACADSAASSWGMVEAIGAIIAARPDIYGAFARHLFNYVGDPGTREAALWGLGEIAATRPDLIRKTPFYVLIPGLNDENAVLRGLTLQLFGRIKAKEAGFQIMALQSDTTPVCVYQQGAPHHTTVAELSMLASRAIHKGEDNRE
ncbi:DVU0298 family protein [Desulfobulbus alkaliphilus]|uniref:DVU0298 family protein n=1 Tax=Desulfobulbus alkaliphilus TaxID=869814 RepID=UPI001965EEA4|nr:DVU0298 family protein [Desulfobulbus alkaliphilus]MBM9535936.1 HEAT repeat domain-containing protein [Desulfobulbus alkaliphilus]